MVCLTAKAFILKCISANWKSISKSEKKGMNKFVCLPESFRAQLVTLTLKSNQTIILFTGKKS